MTRTFLVALVLDEAAVANVAEVAEEIDDSLTDDGFDVESVKPWASPLEGQAASPLFPQPPTQPIPPP